MRLPGNKQLVISAPANSAANRYVQAASWNGKLHRKNWVSHAELVKGGVLQFAMGQQPNRQRGTTKTAYPYSLSKE